MSIERLASSVTNVRYVAQGELDGVMALRAALIKVSLERDRYSEVLETLAEAGPSAYWQALATDALAGHSSAREERRERKTGNNA